MDPGSFMLDHNRLRRFAAARGQAIDSVVARFYREHASIYARFGERGRDACREDLAYHLDFLLPVLEFGVTEPMVAYLRWLANVLETRGIPNEHISQSLDWLAEFFSSGHDDCGVSVAAALNAVKAKFNDPGKPAAESGFNALPVWPESTDFETALLAGDRRGARALMEQCLGHQGGLVEAELGLIQPALYRIGEKWQANQVSVGQEHLATAIAQSVMVEGLLRCESAPENGKKVLLACVQGNRHAVGLQMVADAFQLAGWEVSYLGADTPTVSIVEHAKLWEPDLLGLSVSFSHQLRAARDTIANIDAAFDRQRPPVMVGGLAINNFGALANRLGADGWSADAASAVVTGERLTSGRAVP